MFVCQPAFSAIIENIYLDKRDKRNCGRRQKKWEGEGEVENWEELQQGGRQPPSHHPAPPVDGVGPEEGGQEGKGAVEREKDEGAQTLVELGWSQPPEAARRQDDVAARVRVVVQLVVHHPVVVHSACCLGQH